MKLVKRAPVAFKKLRTTNYFLRCITLLLALYVGIAPFAPALILKFKQSTDKTNGIAYKSDLADQAQKDGQSIDAEQLKEKPKQNTLVIPKISVDTPILDGPDERTLDHGIWRRPKTSTPDKGSNTVITAHRFMYTSGPHTFYSLDKVTKGDKVLVFWEGKEYTYEVFETKVVQPTELAIENGTKDPIITLYTCTPLWTAKERLVVKAKLIS